MYRLCVGAAYTHKYRLRCSSSVAPPQASCSSACTGTACAYAPRGHRAASHVFEQKKTRVALVGSRGVGAYVGVAKARGPGLADLCRRKKKSTWLLVAWGLVAGVVGWVVSGVCRDVWGCVVESGVGCTVLHTGSRLYNAPSTHSHIMNT